MVTEICNEINVVKRSKIIKHFIKIASKSLVSFIILIGVKQHIVRNKILKNYTILIVDIVHYRTL